MEAINIPESEIRMLTVKELCRVLRITYYTWPDVVIYGNCNPTHQNHFNALNTLEQLTPTQKCVNMCVGRMEK